MHALDVALTQDGAFRITADLPVALPRQHHEQVRT
jgi:hypothetical protein